MSNRVRKRKRRKDYRVNNTDGWGNVLVGLGGRNDKTMKTEVLPFNYLTDEELSLIYGGGGLGKTIIDAVADDMTKKWIKIKNDNDNRINKYLQQISAQTKFNEALKWKRLYGGSVIIIGADDGRELSEPLNLKNIKSIEYLKPISRTEIFIDQSEFEEDPKNRDFGKVKVFFIRHGIKQTELQVHKSRVIDFYGDLVPPSNLISTNTDLRYWGISALQAVYDDIKDFGAVNQSISNILLELIIGKYKLSNLANLFSQGQESKVIKRVEYINAFKSTINGVILDAENEDYTRDSANISGLAEIVDRKMMFVCASARIPVTRLFGRSPAGQNATGKSDMDNYYDMIRTQQINQLKMPLQELVNIIASIEKNIDEPEIEFRELEEMSEKEKAEIDKLNSETDKTYIDYGVYDAEYVQQNRFPEILPEDLNNPENENEELSEEEKENALIEKIIAKMNNPNPEPEPPTKNTKKQNEKKGNKNE